jgi:hypothetical protein
MKLLRTMFAEVVSLLDPDELLLPLSQYIGSCGNGHTTSFTSHLWYLCQLIGPPGYGSCGGFSFVRTERETNFHMALMIFSILLVL